MPDPIPELAVVALTAPVTTTHATNGTPLTLYPGDTGTVVMVYGNGEAYMVEFMEGGGSSYTRVLVAVPAEIVREVWRA